MEITFPHPLSIVKPLCYLVGKGRRDRLLRRRTPALGRSRSMPTPRIRTLVWPLLRSAHVLAVGAEPGVDFDEFEHRLETTLANIMRDGKINLDNIN